MSINIDQNGTVVFPDGTPVQTLRWSELRSSIAVIVSSVRVELPEDCVIIEISATESCYINFGDVTVVASSTIADDGSRIFLAGVQAIQIPLDSAGVPFTYISAIRVATDGVLQVEKLV